MSRPITQEETREFLGRLCESARPSATESNAIPVFSEQQDEDGFTVLAVDFGMDTDELSPFGCLHLYFDGDRFAYGFTVQPEPCLSLRSSNGDQEEEQPGLTHREEAA